MRRQNLWCWVFIGQAITLSVGCEHLEENAEGDYGSVSKEIGELCDQSGECASGYCNNDICCEGSYSTCCQDSDDCTASAPVCSDDFTCARCTSDRQCAAGHPDRPRCDRNTGACVECLSHSDCRHGSSVPFNSSLGLCTPDKTCTCWVETEDHNRWSCEKQDDCPDGLVCAKERNRMMHHACLKPCQTEGEPENGFGCTYRGLVDSDEKALLWGPMTSCYAYDMFGRSCLADHLSCRAVANISPWYEDGYCLVDSTMKCSYFCNDLENPQLDMDSWCPDGYVCRNKVCEAK